MAGRVRVDSSGPWFRKDPRRTYRENVRAMLADMASAGATRAARDVPHRSGDLAGGITGRVTNLRGRKWALSAVVAPTHVEPWAHPRPGGAQYRGGKLKARTRAFKNARYAIRPRGDLAKGLT